MTILRARLLALRGLVLEKHGKVVGFFKPAPAGRVDEERGGKQCQGKIKQEKRR